MMTSTDKLSQSPDTDFSVGSIVFDRFEILEEVAAGAQGRVYKATDLLLNITVALKVLLSTAGNDRSIMRFQQEARMASKMKHQQIATIYDFGIFENTPFLSMEFVAGESLDSILKREHTLPLLDFLEIFLQVCEAIQHAHEAGIIHRDIKPGNIVVSKAEDGTTIAKVLDFGVAKTMDVIEENSGRLTPTGNIIGSPFYMSPEQSQGLPLTTESDSYSLGCVMWTALAGDPPFVRDNVMETLLCHVNEELPKLSSIVDDAIPFQLTEVIDNLLAKDPVKRPELKTTVVPVLVELLNGCIADLHKAASAIGERNSDTAYSAPLDFSSTLTTKLFLAGTALGFLIFVGIVSLTVYTNSQVEDSVKLTKTAHNDFMEGLKIGSSKQEDVVTTAANEKYIEMVRQGKRHDLSLGFGYQREALLKCAGLTALRKLDLTMALVYDNDIKEIAKIPNLDYLALNRTQVKTLDGLEKLRKLRGLELKNTAINNQSLRNIGKVKTLENLNLTNANIDDEGIKFLAGLQNLQVLDLTGTNVNAKGAQYIKKLSTLRELRLNHTNLPEAVIRDILRMPSLQTIKIEQCKSVDAGKLMELRYAFPTVAFNQDASILRDIDVQVANAAKSKNYKLVYDRLHDAIRLLKMRFGSGSPQLADSEAKLAVYAAVLGKKSEALQLIQSATDYAERTKDKSLILSTLNYKISVDENWGTNLDLLATEERTLKLEQSMYGPDSVAAISRTLRIAGRLLAATQYAKALQLVERDEAIQKGLHRTESRDVFVGTNFTYAECLRYKGKNVQASKHYVVAIDRLEQIYTLSPAYLDMLVVAHLGKADCDIKLGKLVEALESSDRAIALAKTSHTIPAMYKISMYTQRAALLDLSGRKLEADKAREKLSKLQSAQKSSAKKLDTVKSSTQN